MWIQTDKDGGKLQQLEISINISDRNESDFVYLIFLCDGIRIYIYMYIFILFFLRNTDQIFIFWVDVLCDIFLFDVYIYSRNYCYARSVFMESDKLAVPRINSCIDRFNLSNQFFFRFFFSFLFILFFFSFFPFFFFLLSILIPADYPIVRSSLYRYALTTIC